MIINFNPFSHRNIPKERGENPSFWSRKKVLIIQNDYIIIFYHYKLVISDYFFNKNRNYQKLINSQVLHIENIFFIIKM